MKILLCNFRHIGDALLITPLIANLHDAYPDADIDVLVNAECVQLFSWHPQVRNIIGYDRKNVKAKNFFGRMAAELSFALSLRGYDIFINTTEGERGAQLALVGGAKIRVGIRPKKGVFARFSPYTHEYLHDEPMRHTVERNLDALRALDLPIVSKKVELFFAPDDEAAIVRLLAESCVLGEFVQIHPASRWLFKCLPESTVAAMIDFLHSCGLDVILTCAPNDTEKKMIENIAALCKKKPISFGGILTLSQTAALSKKAKFFFGVDSAPMHMAASQNTPCVAVFGPSGAFNWGPWDNGEDECQYTKRNGVQKMGKHTVVQMGWDCVPCGRDGCDGSKKSDCLIKMEPEKIIEIFKKYL